MCGMGNSLQKVTEEITEPRKQRGWVNTNIIRKRLNDTNIVIYVLLTLCTEHFLYFTVSCTIWI